MWKFALSYCLASLLISEAAATQLDFKVCWFPSGGTGILCQNSRGESGSQRAMINLRGIASFHTVSIIPVHPFAKLNIEYACHFKHTAPENNDDTDNQTNGKLCPLASSGTSAYIKRVSIKVTGERSSQVVLRYRCLASRFGSADQWPDPPKRLWISDQKGECGTSDDNTWISAIEISSYVITSFP